MKLKKIAEYFLHPEKPVEADGLASARSFFDRPSAAEVESIEEVDEKEQILAEVAALKKIAVNYMHPERPVEVSDDTACARCFFSRASAPEYDDEEEDEERETIMEELAALKKYADFYQHPEKPIAVDPTVFGRNFFDRPSAEEKETFYEAEQRNLIVEEMKQLKKLAVDYLHPERPVVPTDSFASGRNYFTRPSAPEYEDDGDDIKRDRMLQDMAALKKFAGYYLHPERPVEIDAATFARSYFDRPSAPEQETFYEAEQRAQIIAEMAQLKQKAIDYMHPELPVTTDAAVFGRNFYSRPSAPEYEDQDEAEERERILEDMAALKQNAVDYMRPELPVSVDDTSFGRNYFSRPSANEKETFFEAEQRAFILEEMAKLKKHAVDYMHPERPLPSMDPTAFGRNYFGRASAPDQESAGEAEERARILAEASALKKLAVDYLHPERPLLIAPTVFARNYFARASAPEMESNDEALERELILADAAALKSLSVDYMHPEVPIKTTDPNACGRNYFGHGSALGHAHYIHSTGYANDGHHDADERSHHDDYGHFDMDEDDVFHDMRQYIVLSGDTNRGTSKITNSKMSSDEEGELSRSPSSVMLFTGVLEDDSHPRLPTMG